MDNENIVEETLKKQLHNAYLKGMAVGGKTFVGTIYEIILKSKRLNPAKTLVKVETACKRMLNVSNEYDKKTTLTAVEKALNTLNPEEGGIDD